MALHGHDAVDQQDLLLRLDERVRAIEARIVADTIIAQGFLLVDRNGKLRGSFNASDDGMVYLSLNDSNGKMRLSISLIDDGNPVLAMLNAEGETVFEVPPREGPDDEDGIDWKAIGVRT